MYSKVQYRKSNYKENKMIKWIYKDYKIMKSTDKRLKEKPPKPPQEDSLYTDKKLGIPKGKFHKSRK